MKNILYLNQYFKHPGEPGSTRSYWISKKLIESGYSVRMIAQLNLGHGGNQDAPRFARKDVDDIEVLYLRSWYSNAMGTLNRIRAFISFMLRASWHSLRENDVDLVIATSTPLTIAVPALLRRYIRGTPYIFEVRDLWPEAPVQMGTVRNKALVTMLRIFEKTVYQKAAHVVTLSPGMSDGVLQYISEENISMIPNMAKIDKFFPREPDARLMSSMGLRSDTFKVVYFGQLGLSNAIPYILDAATLLDQIDPQIQFIFVGHGMMRDRIIRSIEGGRMCNVRLFNRRPMNEISEIVNFCDVSLVTFSDVPILRTNSPNKLFDSLSAGKPIIVNSSGWTKQMVEKHDCGVFVDPKRPEDLVEKIKRFRDDEALLIRQGKNARTLAELEYDKSILCERFLGVVESCLSDSKLLRSSCSK